MREWDSIYPQYGFAQHKGYGTAKNILLQLKNMDYVQYIEEVLQDILSNEKIIFQPVVH